MNDFAARLGHMSNECLRQILRIISNDLWGAIISVMDVVRYIADSFDDGIVGRDALLMLFAKCYYPPPSAAPPSGIVLRTSYWETQDLVEPKDCVVCKRPKVRSYVLCTNDHATCAECVRTRVCLIFKCNIFSSIFCPFLFFAIFYHFEYYTISVFIFLFDCCLSRPRVPLCSPGAAHPSSATRMMTISPASTSPRR